MKWLLSLLGIKPPPPVLTLEDPDFGKIVFDGDVTGIWQSLNEIDDPKNNANYGFSCIPGDRSGPSPQARTFLLQKKGDLPAIWSICSSTLEEVCARWKEKGLKLPVREQFIISSLAMEEDFDSSGLWEVGFQSKGDFWIYVAVSIKDGKVATYSCDT